MPIYNKADQFEARLRQLDADEQLWREIETAAPSADEVKDAKESVDEAQAMLDELSKELKRKVVARANAIGFPEAGEEIGVSAKQLHVWRDEVAPNTVNRSNLKKRNQALRREWEDRYDEFLESQGEPTKFNNAR